MFKMELEKIAVLSDSTHISVLNLKDGTQYSSFRLPDYPYDLFQRGNLIFVGSSSALRCYDFFGNEKWKVQECYGGSNQPVTFNNNGFYTVHSWIRSEVGIEDLDTKNILGETFYYPSPNQQDLWLAHIDFQGKIRWYNLAKEKAQPYKTLFANDRKIIVPYHQVLDSDEEKTGFLVCDLEGKVAVDFQDCKGHPLALIGNKYIFDSTLGEEESDKIYYVFYDTEKLKPDFSIEVLPLPLDDDCKVIGDRVFKRSSNFFRGIDLDRGIVIDYMIPNSLLEIVNEHLVIVKSTPKKSIDCYTADMRNMKKIWSFDIPEHTQTNIHNCHNKGILISTKDNSFFLNPNGEIEWKNSERNIKKVATIIN